MVVRSIVALLAVCLINTCYLSVAAAGPEGLDAPTYQLWERHWRYFAQKCALYEDEYLCSPTFNKRYPSSAGITMRRAQQELAETVEYRKYNMTMTRTIKMPVAEAQAVAMVIPKLRVGHYGYLFSAEVESVLGPSSMLISDIQLIDAGKVSTEYKADRAKARSLDDPDEAEALVDKMYSHREVLLDRQKQKNFKRAVIRLEGFPTRGISEGQRWEGPRGEGFQVLLVRQELYGEGRQPRMRLVGVEPSRIAWGLDEDAFIALLAERDLDPAGFVALIMSEMAENDPETAREEVFSRLMPPPADPDRRPETQEKPADNPS
jgi:hypothetical protein